MSLMVFKEFFLEIISHMVANHGFESTRFLMERIDANHLWVTDDESVKAPDILLASEILVNDTCSGLSLRPGMRGISPPILP